MTRLERKEAELQKFIEYRDTALKKNDVMWLSRNRQRIYALENELAEMRKHVAISLKDQLKDRGEEVKNRFYVGMIRISMLADVVNEACEEVRDLMKNELNAVDFTLRKEVEDMTNLSRRIASFVCATGHPALEDCIVDDDKFVDACMKLATKHIVSKLKIKTRI